jgi:hypothetical protein
MPRVDVGRLAAIDMHGLAGTRVRRTIIVTEFVLGFPAAFALGVYTVLSADSAFWSAFGIWLLGIGVNYLPLALHAISLLRPGRLSAELTGVDIEREARYYTLAQLWLLVPFLFVVLALRERKEQSVKPDIEQESR